MIDRLELEEKISDVLADCSIETLMEMWNNFGYEEIYTMEEAITDYLCNEDVEDLIRLGADGFDTYDEYAHKNSWGHWESLSDPFEVISTGSIVQHIIEADEDFDIYEIRELLDKANEPEYDEEEVKATVKVVINDKLPDFVGAVVTEVVNRLNNKGENENA